ncbi:MAG: carbon starvation protein A [Abditibacteriota bacterium]|nr:carbon starvation protein A [Abditibacteriota bacterium]
MTLVIIFISGIIILFLGYKFYGSFLCKEFEVDKITILPSKAKEDGVDFIPTKLWVLFGHHFSSIAGAGPIIGPITAALLFGWIPALLWILIGAIFMGGLHDMASLVASVRNDGESISSICKKYLSPVSYKTYLGFVLLALIYIIIVFCDLTSSTFAPTSTDPAQIKSSNGIAYASFFYIILAMCFGILTKTKKLSFIVATCIFVPLVFIVIFATQYMPIMAIMSNANPKVIFSLIILAYCFIASLLPVWFLLQPRDYLSSFLLFACILFSFIGIIIAGPTGHINITFPAWTGWYAQGQGYLFPVLFVTIACGAISGFHSMVSSGTTSKQVESPKDIKRIGYGAMIVESVLALIALCSIMICFKGDTKGLTPNEIFATGFGNFVSSIGIPAIAGKTFALLAISTFLLTTLDTCTRLARYIAEEFVGKKNFGLDLLYTFCILALPVIMVFVKMPDPANSDTFIPIWKAIWPVFGATNQLLAALALLVIYIIRVYKKKSTWFIFIPMLFMMVTSIAGLGQLVIEGIHANNYLIAGLSGVLIILAAIMCIDVIFFRIRSSHKKMKEEVDM